MPFQIWHYTNFRSLISYHQTNFGLGSLCLPFLIPRGRNCESFDVGSSVLLLFPKIAVSKQTQLYQNKIYKVLFGGFYYLRAIEWSFSRSTDRSSYSVITYHDFKTLAQLERVEKGVTDRQTRTTRTNNIRK